MTEFKKISELEKVDSISDSDLFIVETLTGTKAITRSAFKEEAGTLTKDDVGLNNVDNTADIDKPVSNATQTALNLKADKTELNSYLTITSASDTYLTKNNASGTYLSKTDASTSYLSKTDAGNTYLTQTDASDTYLSKTDAGNTYLTQTDVSTTYATKQELNEALADLETLLSEV